MASKFVSRAALRAVVCAQSTCRSSLRLSTAITAALASIKNAVKAPKGNRPAEAVLSTMFSASKVAGEEPVAAG